MHHLKCNVVIIFVVIITVTLFAISNQSYWIDEMTCKRIATSGSWNDFSVALTNEKGSDAQMPLFQAIMFCWDKICGSSERGFRAINLLFWLIGLGALSWFMRQRDLPIWGVIVATGTSAFLWYYLDEARPYSMQFAGASCLLAGYWTRLVSDRGKWAVNMSWVMLIFGTLLCAGSSLLGAPLAGVVFLCVLIDHWRSQALCRRGERIYLSLWCVILCAFACYYGLTLINSKGASSTNQTTLLSLGFVAFEQLGFMPYGAGRLGLRDSGIASLLPWLGGLATWLVCVVIVVLVGGKVLLQGEVFERVVNRALLPVVGVVAILVVVGYVGGFRILGRHFMPVFPLLLVVTGLAYVKLWDGGWLRRVICVIMVALAFWGCLTQRYSKRHQKDDYRGAVAYVNSTSVENPKVWWAAAVPIYDFDGSIELRNVRNSSEKDLLHLSRPNLVVLSKVDLYDAHGALRHWLTNNNYLLARELPAFKIYKQANAE